MIKYLTGFLILSTINSFAQKDTAISFSEVVSVDSATKDQLFYRARSWFNDAFKSSKDVIQIQDKETGEISGKGNITSTIMLKSMFGKIPQTDNYSFSLKIFVKDGKYKYEANDFEGSLGTITSSNKSPIKEHPLSSQSYNDNMWKKAKENLIPKINSMIASLKDAMVKNYKPDF